MILYYNIYYIIYNIYYNIILARVTGPQLHEPKECNQDQWKLHVSVLSLEEFSHRAIKRWNDLLVEIPITEGDQYIHSRVTW